MGGGLTLSIFLVKINHTGFEKQSEIRRDSGSDGCNLDEALRLKSNPDLTLKLTFVTRATLYGPKSQSLMKVTPKWFQRTHMTLYKSLGDSVGADVFFQGIVGSFLSSRCRFSYYSQDYISRDLPTADDESNPHMGLVADAAHRF